MTKYYFSEKLWAITDRNIQSQYYLLLAEKWDLSWRDGSCKVLVKPRPRKVVAAKEVVGVVMAG
mgnify:CR=1 FL=1